MDKYVKNVCGKNRGMLVLENIYAVLYAHDVMVLRTWMIYRKC